MPHQREKKFKERRRAEKDAKRRAKTAGKRAAQDFEPIETLSWFQNRLLKRDIRRQPVRLEKEKQLTEWEEMMKGRSETNKRVIEFVNDLNTVADQTKKRPDRDVVKELKKIEKEERKTSGEPGSFLNAIKWIGREFIARPVAIGTMSVLEGSRKLNRRYGDTPLGETDFEVGLKIMFPEHTPRSLQQIYKDAKQKLEESEVATPLEKAIGPFAAIGATILFEGPMSGSGKGILKYTDETIEALVKAEAKDIISQADELLPGLSKKQVAKLANDLGSASTKEKVIETFVRRGYRIVEQADPQKLLEKAVKRVAIVNDDRIAEIITDIKNPKNVRKVLESLGLEDISEKIVKRLSVSNDVFEVKKVLDDVSSRLVKEVDRLSLEVERAQAKLARELPGKIQDIARKIVDDDVISKAEIKLLKSTDDVAQLTQKLQQEGVQKAQIETILDFPPSALDDLTPSGIRLSSLEGTLTQKPRVRQMRTSAEIPSLERTAKEQLYRQPTMDGLMRSADRPKQPKLFDDLDEVITEVNLEDLPGKKTGHTELIIESLKRKGWTDADIKGIILPNGERLVDTIKVKRETNGFYSAVITKREIAEITKNAGGDFTKWRRKKPVKDLLKDAKSLAEHYYELPQVFFKRTGLVDNFYHPVRGAERNASKMKTDVWRKFKEAGLAKDGGIFSPERFTISKKDSKAVGRYYLTRQGKAFGKDAQSYNALSEKAKKFVDIFDDFIKEHEERFYYVAKLNGKDPGIVKDYAPIMTSKDFVDANRSGNMDFIFRKHPAFSALKKRADDVPFDFYEQDYRRVASRYIDQLSEFNHVGEITPQMKYLAESEEFVEAVGKEVAETTQKWLRSITTPPKVEKGGLVSRFFRKAGSIAGLGLNIASVLKQALTQIPLTIIEKAPPKLRSKFAKDFNIKVADLPSIRERRGNLAIMDMQSRLEQAFVGPLSAFDKKNAQLSLNRLLDREYAKFLKTGKPITKEAQELIMRNAQDTLDMWYGGMTKSQLPGAFRTEVGKMLNMFIMPLTSQLNGFIYSIAREKGIKKAQKVAEVLTSALTIAYLEQVITNMSPVWSDEKKMTEDVLTSLAGNIPLISQIVWSLRTEQPIAVSPIFQSASKVAKTAGPVYRGEDEPMDLVFAVAELFGAPKQIRRTTEGVIMYMEDGYRDKNGELLAPIKGTDEWMRTFIRGKYGSIAAQDYMRNVMTPREDRRWHVPQVEFLQNGDYTRKVMVSKEIGRRETNELLAEMSDGEREKFRRYQFADLNPNPTAAELGAWIDKYGLDGKPGPATKSQMEAHAKKVKEFKRARRKNR